MSDTFTKDGTSSPNAWPIISADGFGREDGNPELERLVDNTESEAVTNDTETAPLTASAVGAMARPQHSGGRKGDVVALTAALVSACVLAFGAWRLILDNKPQSLGWFAFHPTLNSLAVVFLTYGILTLQPTSLPRSKEAGLARHQLVMLALALPAITLGTSAIVYNKWLHDAPSLTTWHSVYGTVSVCCVFTQALFGGASVWFGGAAFGGGMKAKALWKYHRLSGYLLLPMLLLTVHTGGGWSDFSVSHSSHSRRFVAFTVAPIVLLASVYARVRPSKMKFI